MRPQQGPSKVALLRQRIPVGSKVLLALIAVAVCLIIVAAWKEVPAPVPQLHRSLLTGSRLLVDRDNNGRSILTVDNSSNTDAVLKLSEFRGQTVRSVYIGQHSKIDLEYLSAGSYQARFVLGEDWDTQAKSFTRPIGYYEFGKTLLFEEVSSSDGTHSSHWEITLNTTPDGDVPRLAISQAAFEAQ